MPTTCLGTWLSERVTACPWTCGLVFSVGAFTVARFLLKTWLVLTQTFILPGRNLKKFGATKGAWAVVTGASDGIGKEFALQLAAAGFNILLVARNQAALTSVAAEIASKMAGKVQTRIQLIDFAKNDPAALNALKSVLTGLDVGVLVNNVGKSHTIPTYFAETTEQENEDIVTININGTVRVTHAVLPGMIQRKCGLILNVGSFAGQVASPMLATYSGTKGFVATFTSALAEEVRAHNIIVQNLNTYFVVSKMSKIKKSSMLVPTPTAYVLSALGKIGLSCGAAWTDRPGTITPFWSHALVDYVIYVIGWKSLFISHAHTILKDQRRRALRKLEREAKKE
ncbi:NAD(P)-binding protein [Imleria badia]|nr:NAD(P)-binding protein [Imleria badia]